MAPSTGGAVLIRAVETLMEVNRKQVHLVCLDGEKLVHELRQVKGGNNCLGFTDIFRILHIKGSIFLNDGSINYGFLAAAFLMSS